MLYLDSSAIAKLAMREAESAALEAFLESSNDELVASVVARVEVLRAARRDGANAIAAAVEALGKLSFLPLDDAIVAFAATLDPPFLRSLDAIHLASAGLLEEALTAFVTYDARLAEAARASGFTVVAPA